MREIKREKVREIRRNGEKRSVVGGKWGEASPLDQFGEEDQKRGGGNKKEGKRRRRKRKPRESRV